MYWILVYWRVLTVVHNFKMRVYQLAIITYPTGKNETTVKFTRQVVKYLHILIPVGDDVFYFQQRNILKMSPTFGVNNNVCFVETRN